MSAVIELTSQKLQADRTAVLRSVDATAESFATRVQSGVLTDDEWAAKEQLDVIEFLLGEQQPTGQ